MTLQLSIIIPAHNAEHTLADCLRAIEAQSIPHSDYEVIVVNDGSTDGTASVAEAFDVRLVHQKHRGGAPARNSGIKEAKGEWIASTDADCLPSRMWLSHLLNTVHQNNGGKKVLGAAGRILGYPSDSPVSRYIDLTGGIDTERHLAHPTFPYAPLGNVMYQRTALNEVGGLNENYSHYPGPDLHFRLCQQYGGQFFFEPRAVVFHHHPTNWKWYGRQQFGYGSGYAQLLLDYQDHFSWSIWQEMRAWGQVGESAIAACWPGRDDRALVRRGLFAKHLAQRLGFMSTYWNSRERQRWQLAKKARRLNLD
jgi:glycosyltransferase involved in cell wall biosynthesis